MKFALERGELLGWIGIIVGIPPLVYLIIHDELWAGGFFCLLITGVFVREYAVRKGIDQKIQSDLEAPTFTLLQVRKSLKFEDATAHLAHFTSVRKVRANKQ